MAEENVISPLAVSHLLQHTLRSVCIHENSQWVYAVFWRILPRNYPPPKWDGQGAYDRSRGNRRNWILVWEDGFCNFAASSAAELNSGDCPSSSSPYIGNCEFQRCQISQGLQPEIFFKMSHEIYNYGEGLIGKVAADHSHKWIYKEPNDEEINFLSSWNNSVDTQPRTWEAQFQSGIKTIALIAVREGVVQLGAIHKVVEDLSSVVLLRKKFNYIESIPGVLLPHPSSSSSSSLYPALKVDAAGSDIWQLPGGGVGNPPELYDHLNHHRHQFRITPSMTSLEALLSKLPSVVPPSSHSPSSSPWPLQFISMEKVAKEEIDEQHFYGPHHHHHHHHHHHVGERETSSSMSAYAYRHQNAHYSRSSRTNNNNEEF